jgi:hypothetical protein
VLIDEYVAMAKCCLAGESQGTKRKIVLCCYFFILNLTCYHLGLISRLLVVSQDLTAWSVAWPCHIFFHFIVIHNHSTILYSIICAVVALSLTLWLHMSLIFPVRHNNILNNLLTFHCA